MILIYYNIIFMAEVFMTSKFIKIFIVPITLVPISLYAQNRIDKPIQVQLNLSGAFISVAGNFIADPTVDDLKVNSWKPGISFGYHLKPNIYVGYALSPSLDLTLKEEWGFSNLSNDGNIILDHKTGKIQNFELRYSPFTNGLYISGAWLFIDKTEYSMQFRRKPGEQFMLIGENEFETDMDVVWNSKSSNQIGFGLGYNWVMISGISLNFGVSVPIKFPENELVVFTPINFSGAKLFSADFDLAEAILNDETFYGPILLLFNVGYNLKN